MFAGFSRLVVSGACWVLLTSLAQIGGGPRGTCSTGWWEGAGEIDCTGMNGCSTSLCGEAVEGGSGPCAGGHFCYCTGNPSSGVCCDIIAPVGLDEEPCVAGFCGVHGCPGSADCEFDSEDIGGIMYHQAKCAGS